MNRPRVRVDFNEMLERDLVLLSKSDTTVDSVGGQVFLREGVRVLVFQEDWDESGRPDNLIAEGVVERHPGTGFGVVAKWCCRIDSNGIRHESEVRA